MSISLSPCLLVWWSFFRARLRLAARLVAFGGLGIVFLQLAAVLQVFADARKCLGVVVALRRYRGVRCRVSGVRCRTLTLSVGGTKLRIAIGTGAVGLRTFLGSFAARGPRAGLFAV
jgi:hypothetical protein